MFGNKYTWLVEQNLLSRVHHLIHVSTHSDHNQGVKMRRKIIGLNTGGFQNKVDLVVNNYLLCNKIKVLCKNA